MSEKITQDVFMERINKIYEAPNIEIKEWNGWIGKIVYYCHRCGETHTRSDARQIFETQDYCCHKEGGCRWGEKNYKNRLRQIWGRDIKILDYRGLSNPLLYNCPDCGKEIRISVARNLLAKNILCTDCAGIEKDAVYKKIKKMFDKNNKYELLKWRGTNEKVDIRCKNCGTIFQRWAKSVSACPDNCPNCNTNHDKTKLDEEEMQARIDEGFGQGQYTLLSYTGQLKKDNKVRCNNCGLIFNAQMSYFITCTRGCPKCQRFKSKGERALQRIFTSLNIPFEEQKRFPDCNNNLSSFDFCFYTKIGQMILIEVNGLQHYKQTTKFGDLKTIQERDNKKIQYCKEHDIYLLIIPYFKTLDVESITEQISSIYNSTTILRK